MSRVIGASGSAMSALAAAESSSRVVARPCMRGCCCAVGAASLCRHQAFARCAVVKGACAATVRTVSSPCSLVRASVRRGCAPGQHGKHCVGALGADGEATGRCTRGLRSSASRSMACEASRCVCKKGARPARGGGDGAGGGAASSSCSACGRSCGSLDDLSLGCRDDVLQCAHASAASFTPASTVTASSWRFEGLRSMQ